MEIPIRATVIFFFLFLVARGMGKRELAQLTAFELLLLVTIGDLVQQGVTQEDFSLTGAMLAVGTIAFWVLVFAFATHRWPRAAEIATGLPVIIVRDGRPLPQVMDMERVTLDEVLEAAREHGIADLGDVHLAILETDGRFSFIERGRDEEPAEPDDRRVV
jgi:uncharacterized membrane protein YcaP (DUF421 family)